MTNQTIQGTEQNQSKLPVFAYGASRMSPVINACVKKLTTSNTPHRPPTKATRSRAAMRTLLFVGDGLECVGRDHVVAAKQMKGNGVELRDAATARVPYPSAGLTGSGSVRAHCDLPAGAALTPSRRGAEPHP